MTTTETLLAEIAAKGRTSIEVAIGTGKQGGRIRYGQRRRDAALALVKAGKVVVISTTRTQHYPGNGACIHCTDIVIAGLEG